MTFRGPRNVDCFVRNDYFVLKKLRRMPPSGTKSNDAIKGYRGSKFSET